MLINLSIDLSHLPKCFQRPPSVSLQRRSMAAYAILYRYHPTSEHHQARHSLNRRASAAGRKRHQSILFLLRCRLPIRQRDLCHDRPVPSGPADFPKPVLSVPRHEHPQ